MVPPTRLGKTPSKPSVLQAVLVKIVTEILFGNAPLADHQTTVLAVDHRPTHSKDRDLVKLHTDTYMRTNIKGQDKFKQSKSTSNSEVCACSQYALDFKMSFFRSFVAQKGY